MKLLLRKQKKEPLSRRELVASRRFSADAAQLSDQAYRRSRTMQSRKHIGEVSERQSAHELRARRRKVLSLLSGSLLLAGGVVFVLYQLSATVIVVAPDRQLGEDAAGRYETVFTDYLAARPLERLRFAVDKAALQSYFLEQAPEVQSVDVIYGGGVATSALQLSFRQPALGWDAGGMRYYVDGTGVTFERNYFDEPRTSVEDKSGVVPEAGQAIINRRFLSFLGQVSATFEASGMSVTQVVLPESTVRQVEFGIEGRGYVIRMTVDRGVKEQVARAIKAMEYLDANGIAPSYIDARVDQRIFYK